jgi:hypothetical protein
MFLLTKIRQISSIDPISAWSGSIYLEEKKKDK